MRVERKSTSSSLTMYLVLASKQPGRAWSKKKKKQLLFVEYWRQKKSDLAFISILTSAEATCWAIVSIRLSVISHGEFTLSLKENEQSIIINKKHITISIINPYLFHIWRNCFF